MKKLAVMFAGLMLAIGLSSCSNEEEKECNHKWTDATCTEPSICSECNEIGGEPLGHQWESATCENPKTCKRCNATEGEKLEHVWLKATCENPKTCNRCKATEGEKLEHEWLEATCESPKTCKYCSDTAGREKGHTASQNVIEETNFKTASITYLTYCKDCGADMAKKVEKLTRLHENGVFYFTANELCDRMNYIFRNTETYNMYTVETLPVSAEEEEFLLLIVRGSEDVPIGAVVIYDYDMDDILDPDSDSISVLQIYGYNSNYDYLVQISFVALMACDPTLDVNETLSVMEDIVLYSEKDSVYEREGIYSWFSDSWECMYISLY